MNTVLFVPDEFDVEFTIQTADWLGFHKSNDAIGVFITLTIVDWSKPFIATVVIGW